MTFKADIYEQETRQLRSRPGDIRETNRLVPGCHGKYPAQITSDSE
jgi:hypothetical protein